MKNWGVSLLDVTDSDGVLRLSFIGIWSEKSTEFKNGRSVLAIEVAKDSLTVDAMFFKFHLKGK